MGWDDSWDETRSLPLYSLQECLQDLLVLLTTEVFSDHLLVASGVLLEEDGDLVGVQGAVEDALLHQKGNALGGFDVELLCACLDQLQGQTARKAASVKHEPG